MVPDFLLDWRIWRDFWPALVVAILVGSVTAFALVHKRKLATHVAIMTSPLALTRVVAGILTGSSREPAVTAVLPAVLSLIGGVSIYYFTGKSGFKRILVSATVFSFVLSLWLGTLWGQRLRYNFEDWRNSYEYLSRIEKRDHAIQLLKLSNEIEIQMLRKRLRELSSQN